MEFMNKEESRQAPLESPLTKGVIARMGSGHEMRNKLPPPWSTELKSDRIRTYPSQTLGGPASKHQPPRNCYSLLLVFALTRQQRRCRRRRDLQWTPVRGLLARRYWLQIPATTMGGRASARGAEYINAGTVVPFLCSLLYSFCLTYRWKSETFRPRWYV
jgi:hypothetical protein